MSSRVSEAPPDLHSFFLRASVADPSRAREQAVSFNLSRDCKGASTQARKLTATVRRAMIEIVGFPGLFASGAASRLSCILRFHCTAVGDGGAVIPSGLP